jgi:hypothetical protein
MEYLIFVCYMSVSLSFYFYNAAIIKSCALINLAKPNARTRKDISKVAKESTLELKLSIVWPVILCLKMINKIRS